MFTILHISDLHRTGGGPISNDELLSGLVADFERGAREEPSIVRPDAIIVSGDLIEGLSLGSDEYPDGLRLQYKQASELIESLCEEFLASDRSRVVIVPGNHDVDWNCARESLVEEPDSASPRSLITELETTYRWSWRDLLTYRIADVELYERRFNFFNEMYTEFYQNAQLSFPVVPDKDWNLFNLDDGNILVSAFNSCVINDCFSDIGHISPSALAACHLEMRRVGKQGCLPIAVWHHGVGGPPLTSDYIDPVTVKLMIDKGFRLGLHGHKHDSTYSPADLIVSTKETMAVIGAGSLSAGLQALPHGVNRRYNVVQIDQENREGLVNVREMNRPDIWGPGQLYESGGKSHVSIQWTKSSLEMVDQTRSGGSVVASADEIEHLKATGRLDEALEKLQSDPIKSTPYGRRLLSNVMADGEKWEELKTLLADPQTDEELALLVRAAESSGDLIEAKEALLAADDSGSFSSELVTYLMRRVEARSRLER